MAQPSKTGKHFRIDYADIPSDFFNQSRAKAKHELFDRIGREVGDGGNFILRVGYKERYVPEVDKIMGSWSADIYELEEENK